MSCSPRLRKLHSGCGQKAIPSHQSCLRRPPGTCRGLMKGDGSSLYPPPPPPLPLQVSLCTQISRYNQINFYVGREQIWLVEVKCTHTHFVQEVIKHQMQPPQLYEKGKGLLMCLLAPCKSLLDKSLDQARVLQAAPRAPPRTAGGRRSASPFHCIIYSKAYMVTNVTWIIALCISFDQHISKARTTIIQSKKTAACSLRSANPAHYHFSPKKKAIQHQMLHWLNAPFQHACEKIRSALRHILMTATLLAQRLR